MCSAIAFGAKPAMSRSIVIASSGWRLTMKKVTRLAVVAAHRRDVEIGDVVGGLGVVGRHVDGDVERVAAAVERGVVERIVDRLLPGGPPFSVMIGAITLTSWAMQAIFTRSARRMKVLSAQPTRSTSSKL